MSCFYRLFIMLLLRSVDICKDLGVTMYLRKQIEKWIAEEEIKRSSNFGANFDGRSMNCGYLPSIYWQSYCSSLHNQSGTSVTVSGVNIDNIPGSVPFLLVSDQTGHFDDMIKVLFPSRGVFVNCWCMCALTHLVFSSQRREINGADGACF